MIEAAAVIPPDITSRRSEIWPSTMKSLDLHRKGPYTLLHSDVHLGNWYISGEGRLGLCDWQCLGTGHWARDLAYALSTTISIDDRRAWEQDLIRRYLQKMQNGCGLNTSFDDAWSLYRQQVLLALMMWTPTLVHSRTTPDMQPEEMSLEMIKRMTAAMSDLRSLDSFV